MKSSKVIGVVILIVIILLVAIYIIYHPPTEEKQRNPEARIEIKRIVSENIVINQGETIFFSGMNSSDKDGVIKDYQWDFDDGNSSSEIDTAHKYEEPGVYHVTLTVVDNDGKKNVTSIQITVINSIPVAKLNVENNPTSALDVFPIYYPIKFNSTASSDQDGNITRWLWDFGDGNSSTAPNPKHTYDDLGYFTIKLTVFDDDGAEATDSIDIEIIPRIYKIEWKLEQIEKVIESNGYTREGESTELVEVIDQEYIGSIDVFLNWTDRQPLLQNNQSQGQDLFELKVITPENISKLENSTSGIIDITVFYVSPLPTKNYQATTANDAISEAYNDAGFKNEGIGEWSYNISALECKGGSWNNDIFDFDVGNLWSLRIIIYYYLLEITDITY